MVIQTQVKVQEEKNVKDWSVTCSFDGHVNTYAVSAVTFYEARVSALHLFLKEFKIPGRPWEYVTRKKNVIDVQVSSLQPRKGTGAKKELPITFYYQQIDILRKLIRMGDFTPKQKKEAGALLLEVREAISG